MDVEGTLREHQQWLPFLDSPEYQTVKIKPFNGLKIFKFWKNWEIKRHFSIMAGNDLRIPSLKKFDCAGDSVNPTVFIGVPKNLQLMR